MSTDLAARAKAADAADPLAHLRARFSLPPDTVYLDGNSLGALPAAVPDRIADVVRRQWGTDLIRSWTDNGWWAAPERIGDRIAPLIGAAPGQVVVGDSTSVNVFRALVSAVRLHQRPQDNDRSEIVVDATTFPTDGYVAESAAKMTGRTLVPAHPRALTDALSHRTAAVLLNHVDFRTGELWDMAALTELIHGVGAYAIWDLSHSAGALPVDLDAGGVDLAVGCTYKYLNGGPGAPAYSYARAELLPRLEQPLPGWCSHRDPFGMEAGYRPADGVTRLRTGTPEMISLLTLDAALDVWDGVDMASVRAKSLALTTFFVECVRALVPADRIRVLTPDAPRRGSQVALACTDAEAVMTALIEARVIGDYRPPDVLRFGFAAPYVGFADALRAAEVIAEVLA
ncbi:kynureninase [Fodinicola feengrottensis]|uniref:Kynureninase n=1 Tax=Fodinicola feengrottensis TaxID=435914 RepID=A0ABN2H324_9ACTN